VTGIYLSQDAICLHFSFLTGTGWDEVQLDASTNPVFFRLLLEIMLAIAIYFCQSSYDQIHEGELLEIVHH